MNTAVDPYLPGHGDSRYGVDHYDLDLQYKVASNVLEARAQLWVTAAEELSELVLDLHGLTVVSLRVTGADVARWAHRASRIRIRLRSAVPEGTPLVVAISYRGQPRAMPGPAGPAGW